MQTNPTVSTKVTRRDWLKTIWGALGGLVALEIGAVTLTYMQPRLAEGQFGSLIAAGPVAEFPAGSVTHIPSGRFYLVRLSDGGFLAIYQRCTHLGCNVNANAWDPAQASFICPCHNSQFNAEGEVLNPPAPRPLDIFQITIEDGMVKVDTSRPISRQKYEADQAVYA